MTAATQSLAGPGTQGNYQQAGFAPTFPAPIGAEYQGFGQQYGYQTPQAFQFPQQSQQIVQQLMNQILPIAQQAVTAQVLSTVAQQLPQLIGQHVQMQVAQQLPQLLWQQSGSAYGWQQPGGPWQQPFGGQQFGAQYGSPWTQQPGLFGQGSRPYAGLS